MTPVTQPDQLSSLAASLRGTITRSADSAYDDARGVWNGMIDKRPAAIVRAAGVADIVSAIGFARANGLPISVRGGGHNVAGNGMCDGGVAIDLASMKTARVDPVRRTARADAGMLWRELDHETQVFGLATPGGVVSTTGIAGLTLGGGFGHLSRLHGMVCDNLLSADLVTADGSFVTASAQENADLFWGLRGGGGNFGVVTSFEYKLHPVSHVYGGLIAFPFDMAPAVMKRYREVTSSAPDQLSLFCGLLPVPGVGKIAGVVASFIGPEDEGRRAIQPIRDLGSILMDTVSTIPYRQLQTMLDPSYPKGLRNYWKSHYLTGLTDDAIALCVDRFAAAPSPFSHIIIEPCGGAVGRVGKDDTAFEHREAAYNMLILSIWTEPGEDDAQSAWARGVWEAAKPWSTGGAYVNYLGVGENINTAYSGARYERLTALKRKFDPENIFRLNQNIRPS